MKIKLSLMIAAVMCAGQASALSCVRPDVAGTFQSVSAPEDTYIVLLGTFSFATPPPQTGLALNPESISLPARFDGQYLGPERFVDGPAFDITLNFTCAASWCGSMRSDAGRSLAFARQTSQGYVLDVGPCGGRVFTRVVDADVQRVEACMRGEACEGGVSLP